VSDGKGDLDLDIRDCPHSNPVLRFPGVANGGRVRSKIFDRTHNRLIAPKHRTSQHSFFQAGKHLEHGDSSNKLPIVAIPGSRG
jgi:hypothetical protein